MLSDQLIFDLIRNLPFTLFRIFTVLLLLMHILFSFIIVRQTKIMSKIVEAQISPVVNLITLIHLFISLAVSIWVVLFLFVFPI